MGWVFGRGFDSRLVHKKTEWRFALLRFFYGKREMLKLKRLLEMKAILVEIN